MKKNFIVSIILILAFVTNLVPAFAEEEALKSDIFTYTISGQTATITCVEDFSGKVVIPEEIDGYKVTAIGEGAFGGSTNVTEVYIPDSVFSIASMCFAYSTSIKTVRLPQGLAAVSEGMFYQCSALTGVTIPYGVTSIASKAFAMCESLTAVTIPNSTKTIAGDAFDGTKNVTFHCYLSENGVGYSYAKAKGFPCEELIAVYVNGKEVAFDQPPITDPKKFRTLVPLRAVLEEMGAEIEWYNDMNYAGINIDGHRILIKPNSEFMRVDGKTKYLSSPAIEYNNRILIPIRDVVESVGRKVSWNEFDKIVTITYNN